MLSVSSNFSTLQLSGKEAFYHNQTDPYKEFESEFPDQANYSVSIDNSVYRFAKTLFKYTVALPYTIFHGIIGYAILQSSLPDSINPYFSFDTREEAVKKMKRKGYEVKRISLEVDGYKVDAQIIGKKKTLENGKWTLFAGGNAQLCNESVPDLLTYLDETKNNLITFNYPSVSSSPGTFPSKEGCYKAIQGLLELLEDKDKGIGATEITTWGLSIGGGFTAEALARHTPKEGIKYAVVKDRAFSELTDISHEICTAVTENMNIPNFVKSTIATIVRIVIKIFGWNINASSSIDTFKAPEYILQKATYDTLKTAKIPKITSVDQLDFTDGVISKKCSLAKRVLSEEFDGMRDQVHLLGLSETHDRDLSKKTLKELGTTIKPVTVY